MAASERADTSSTARLGPRPYVDRFRSNCDVPVLCSLLIAPLPACGYRRGPSNGAAMDRKRAAAAPAIVAVEGTTATDACKEDSVASYCEERDRFDKDLHRFHDARG